MKAFGKNGPWCLIGVVGIVACGPSGGRNDANSVPTGPHRITANGDGGTGGSGVAEQAGAGGEPIGDNAKSVPTGPHRLIGPNGDGGTRGSGMAGQAGAGGGQGGRAGSSSTGGSGP